MRNEDVLHRVKEERNILHTTKRRQAKWIRYILCRNCCVKHIIEGKIEEGIEVTGRQRIRRKQLIGRPHRTEMMLGIQTGSTRSHSVDQQFVINDRVN